MLEMPQNPIAIANFFVEKATETGGEVTPMKLLKLVYIAHGWHLGLYETPLIGESIEAWKFGPVVRSVYHAFKEYGAAPVTSSCGNKSPDPSDYDFLNKIWDVYKGYSGTELSAITHEPNTPWAIITEPYKKRELPQGLLIPNRLIMDYYRGLENAGEPIT